jgi:hypothetical protein
MPVWWRDLKINAVFAGIVAGIVSAIVSYSALISRATFAAIAIRRKFPNAWFSGSITWYAAFVVIGVSLVIAGTAFRMVYKHSAQSSSTM